MLSRITLAVERMLAKVQSVALTGIDAVPVEVETDLGGQFGKGVIVGLPDAAVRESLDRISSAITNSGFLFPANKKVVVNLAPADLRKEGPSFDLPIALGILAAADQLKIRNLEQYAVVGELALDGSVRSVRGALSVAMRARGAGFKGLLVPHDNAAEAALADGIEVFAVRSLQQAVQFLNGDAPLPPAPCRVKEVFQQECRYDIDYSEVKGQEHAKRALAVAAAGGHNLLMVGPPGAGKSMLAKRLPTILPELSLRTAMETTLIYSAAGLLGDRPMVATRPFRQPHHTISYPALIGGGPQLRPGEISLAHNGVLFLDEFPEFDRRCREVLRQPLENEKITLDRSAGSVEYPADFMLVVAMNPCPCGYLNDPRKRCRCTVNEVQKYLSKVSGPLLDRIDIHLEVPALPIREITTSRPGSGSGDLRKMVERARRVQAGRFQSPDKVNSQLTPGETKRHCALSTTCTQLLAQAMEELSLSARAYNHILRTSRTIADMEESAAIEAQHLSEAIQYRSLDKGLFS